MRSCSPERPALSLKIMANVFNVVPKNSQLRYPLLINIIQYSTEKGLVATVAHFFDNLPLILDKFGATPEQARGAHADVAAALESTGDSRKALLHHVRYLRTFGAGEALTPEAEAVAVQVVTTAIGDADTFQMDDL